MSKSKPAKPDPEQSIADRLIDLHDDLSAVSDLLEAADMASASHEGHPKQSDAMSRLLGVVAERLEAAKAELDAIRHAV
jgi:hypothetical protein